MALSARETSVLFRCCNCGTHLIRSADANLVFMHLGCNVHEPRRRATGAARCDARRCRPVTAPQRAHDKLPGDSRPAAQARCWSRHIRPASSLSSGPMAVSSTRTSAHLTNQWAWPWAEAAWQLVPRSMCGNFATCPRLQPRSIRLPSTTHATCHAPRTSQVIFRFTKWRTWAMQSGSSIPAFRV